MILGGAATNMTASVLKKVSESKLIKLAQELYNKDLELSKNNKELIIDICNMEDKTVELSVEAIGRARTARNAANLAHSGTVVSTAANISKFTKAAGGIGLILVPVDIYFIVNDSISHYKGSTNEAAKQIRKVADEKEDELKKYLAGKKPRSL